MVSPRANWKGFIKFGEVSCAVALYTAASSSERIAFNTLNRATGNRVRREFIDGETGDTVERDDQVKGYETEEGHYVVLEPEEVSAAIPETDKTLKIESFIPCSEIDTVYFDKPYYLTPDKMGTEAYVLLRDGMKQAKVAAIARTVLFRRLRTVLIRPHGNGLIASTLNFDYEVRSSQEAFDDLPDMKSDPELLEIAELIIAKKKGSFDASSFDDRYEDAVAELVKAKIEGRSLPKKKEHSTGKVIDLREALRESAGLDTQKTKSRKGTANAEKGASGSKAKKAAAKAKPAAQTRRAS
jgi:DNA end-binding protein Ku